MTEADDRSTLWLQDYPYQSQRMPVFASNVVATSQPLAAQAGLRMLDKGGNAVDAAIAAAIALTVVEPTSNGIGGDLFALVWDGGALHGLNGSGRSPAGWAPERFSGLNAMPQTGWDSITVPGAVDAWARLSNRFGKLSFDALFEPAIGYAREGFQVGPVTSSRWQEAANSYRGFAEFCQTFLIDGKAPSAGQRFRCPDQAGTLERIAESGGTDFYRGGLAARIAAASASSGGALSLEDLEAHRSQWTEPVSITYRGVTLHEMPPNGQGLAALIALGILERFDLGHDPPDSADSVHLQLEAMKAAFRVAVDHIADPDWMPTPPKRYLSADFLDRQAKGIHPNRAAKFEPVPADRGGTVYLAAADANGGMVSLIQSNYLGFGSGIVIPGTGISMQNRGRGFVLTEGHPNCVAGAKRPYHTIIPAFVTRQGRPLMSFGVMGGHMQPQGHVQMMVRIFDHRQNPQAACDAPRWMVDQDFNVALEAGFSPTVKKELINRGHRLIDDMPPYQFGGAQVVFRLDDGYCAASDPRKEGQAVGF
jgi:gamma-glutamyltranspeptidase/glutathione hydrolase